jgi:hypothetical protein
MLLPIFYFLSSVEQLYSHAQKSLTTFYILITNKPHNIQHMWAYACVAYTRHCGCTHKTHEIKTSKWEKNYFAKTYAKMADT